MADSNNPLDVRIIDFLGNQNLIQLTENMGAFRNEIEQLKDSINALSTSTTEATKAQQNLAENMGAFYKRGHSDQASTGGRGPLLGPDGEPISTGTGLGPSEGSSRPTTEVADVSLNELRKRMQSAMSQQSGLRNKLRAATDTAFTNSGTIDLPGIGPRMDSTSGPNGPSSGASSGASSPFPQLPEKPEPAQIPQFGEFQVDTLLRMMGGFAQRGAERKARNNPDSPDAGTGYAKAAFGLYKAAEFAPVAEIAKQYAGSFG